MPTKKRAKSNPRGARNSGARKKKTATLIAGGGNFFSNLFHSEPETGDPKPGTHITGNIGPAGFYEGPMPTAKQHEIIQKLNGYPLTNIKPVK